MKLRSMLAAMATGLCCSTFAVSALAADVTVSDAWARPTAPGAKVGGAFLQISNSGAADKVLSASAGVSEVVELHTHVMEGGVAKMRKIPAIEVPAGGKVELKPGSLHIMLINLKAPLKAGESFPLKLKFEKAGEVEVKVAIQSPAAKAEMPMGDHAHMKH